MKYKKKLVKFKDLGKIITGKTPRTKNKSYWNGTIKFLTPRDMQDGKYSSYTERYITQKGADSVKNSILKNPSISVSCIGNIGYVTYNREKMITNQQINSIIPNEKYDSHYLYYAMKNYNKEFKMLENQSTTISILNKTEFSNLEIKVFDNMKVQEQISRVLSSLDDKIELNNKINKNLEDLAQTLYKQWFVDFEFPNEEGLPYKSSGGKMVESELGLIPEGWNVEYLNNLFNFVGGSQPPKKEHIYEYKEGYVRFIQNRDYSGNNNHLTYIKESTRNKVCNKYDIMMDKYGEAGKVRFGIEGAYNVALAKIDTDLKYREFLRRYFEQKQIQNYILNSSQASTRPSVNASVFVNLKVVIPSNNLLEKFDKVSFDIIKKNILIKEENFKLEKLRDLLLPKLMSGEIRVPIKE